MFCGGPNKQIAMLYLNDSVELTCATTNQQNHGGKMMSPLTEAHPVNNKSPIRRNLRTPRRELINSPGLACIS